MKKDFLEFLNSQEVEVPTEIQKNIYEKIKEDFKPLNALSVLSKFLFLNFSAGFFTLAICPQFGFGPFSKGHDITHFFMGIGVWACAVFCAIFYFAISQTLALLILSHREIQWVSKRKLTLLPLIVMMTFFIFMLAEKLLSSSTSHPMPFNTEYKVIWILVGLFITQASLYLYTRKIKKFSKSALR
jgi:hypothetical protein